MRVADYIFKYLNEEAKVDTIFMVTGGGAMFLNDAVGQNKNIKYICCHHEQAAGMAASGYSRYTGKLGVCVVTTGCGGTNVITSVLGAFQDRVPLLIISGQIKTKECMRIQNTSVRQLGVQEADIIEIVEPITVYHETIINKESIKKSLETACWSAINLQGPAWIDIPIDIQGAEIED
jgi:acetolactate synthase I/II/III large subunit